MLSNAFLRSMKHACTFPLACFYIYISCSMTKDWVAHEWCFLKPAWFGDSISFSFVCFSNLSYSSLSITFVHTFVSDIGLCCIGFFVSFLSFGIRKISAWHMLSGILCCYHISCVSFVVMANATCPPYFKSSAVILSGPGAFLIGRWSMMSLIFYFEGEFVFVSLLFSPISSVSSYSVFQYSLN